MSTMNEKFDAERFIEEELVPLALDKTLLLLESDNEAILRDVIKDVLDRGKETSRKSIEHDNRSVNVLSFDPNYLATAMKGVMRVLKDDTSVDVKRVGKKGGRKRSSK